MEVRSNIPLLEEILAEYKNVIGEDFRPYKNHVYRVVNFCLQLKQNIDKDQVSGTVMNQTRQAKGG